VAVSLLALLVPLAPLFGFASLSFALASFGLTSNGVRGLVSRADCVEGSGVVKSIVEDAVVPGAGVGAGI
jgi:hypothetical protein